mgnify:CR=1 FL=1
MSDFKLNMFDGKKCAATSCGTQSQNPLVHAFLESFRQEQHMSEYLKGAAQDVVHAGAQAVSAAEGFVKSQLNR